MLLKYMLFYLDPTRINSFNIRLYLNTDDDVLFYNDTFGEINSLMIIISCETQADWLSSRSPFSAL